MWLADPTTREALPAIPSKEREISYAQKHWRPGWLSGFDRENGIPVRMWFAECPDSCCDEYRATRPSLDELVAQARR